MSKDATALDELRLTSLSGLVASQPFATLALCEFIESATFCTAAHAHGSTALLVYVALRRLFLLPQRQTGKHVHARCIMTLPSTYLCQRD